MIYKKNLNKGQGKRSGSYSTVSQHIEPNLLINN